MSSLYDALGRDETASIASTAMKIKDPVKKAWCQTQWTNLSFQAQEQGLPDVYLDDQTNLLDKLTSKKLWQLLVGGALVPLMITQKMFLAGLLTLPYACRTAYTTSLDRRRHHMLIRKCWRVVQSNGIIMQTIARVLSVRLC